MPVATLEEQAGALRPAARVLATLPDATRAELVRRVASALEVAAPEILAINAEEVARFDGEASGLDRLTLNESRITGIVSGLRAIAELPDPLGEVVDHTMRPNGLDVSRVRVPLGVIGVIYENRPNVTMDVAALCLRSGNAAFLRGSSSAQATNLALVALWHGVLSDARARSRALRP